MCVTPSEAETCCSMMGGLELKHAPPCSMLFPSIFYDTYCRPVAGSWKPSGSMAAGGDGAGEGAGERGVWAGYALRGHGADAVMGGRGGVDGGVVHHERPVQKLDDVWSPDVAWDAGPGAEGGQRVVAAVDAAGGEVGGGCKLDVDARWVAVRACEGVPGAADFDNTGVHPVGGDDRASSGAGRDGGGNCEEEGEEGGDCGKHGER